MIGYVGIIMAFDCLSVTLFIVALRVGVASRAKSCTGALKMLDVFLAAKLLHFVPSYVFAVQHCWMYLHATKCTGKKLVEEMLREVLRHRQSPRGLFHSVILIVIHLL